jgi:hypothetical protein
MCKGVNAHLSILAFHKSAILYFTKYLFLQEHKIKIIFIYFVTNTLT